MRSTTLALTVALAACGGGLPEGPRSEAKRHMTGEVADLLERRCTSCHGDSLAGPGGLSSRDLASTHGLLTLEESMRFHRWMAGSPELSVCTWGRQALGEVRRERTGTHGFMHSGTGCAVCPFQAPKAARFEPVQAPAAAAGLLHPI